MFVSKYYLIWFPINIRLYMICRYCSSYNYGNHDFSSSSSSMMKSMEICDWCKSEGRNNSSSTNTTKSYKRSSSMDHNHHHHSITNSTSQGDQRIKRHQLQDHHIITNNTNNTVSGSSSRNHSNKNNSSGIPSPRPNAHRRYKLLKDVMCWSSITIHCLCIHP